MRNLSVCWRTWRGLSVNLLLLYSPVLHHQSNREWLVRQVLLSNHFALLINLSRVTTLCFHSQGLQNGDISLVIGTHSLIAEKVEFSALRIAVVDEQHRFGVIQRGRFNSKVVCFCWFAMMRISLKFQSCSVGILNPPVYDWLRCIWYVVGFYQGSSLKWG